MPENLGVTVIIAVIGACFGSFITAASWRLPRNEDIVKKPSYCPKCNSKLGFFDLFPILSWLLAGGKCRHCKAKISPRYVLTEIATTLIFLVLFYKYGLSANFFILALLAVAMLILIISDFETYIIPDSTTIAALILAIIYHYLNTADWTDYITGFIGGLVIALAVKYGFYFVTKRDGLGFGDVKFLPVAGLWIGFSAFPVFLILSGLVGIITGIVWKVVFKNPEYPFGPALAVAMFLLIVFPQANFLGDVAAVLK